MLVLILEYTSENKLEVYYFLEGQNIHPVFFLWTSEWLWILKHQLFFFFMIQTLFYKKRSLKTTFSENKHFLHKKVLFLENILYKVLQGHKNIPVSSKRRLSSCGDWSGGGASHSFLSAFMMLLRDPSTQKTASVSPDVSVRTRTATLTLRVRPRRCSQFLSSLPVFIHTTSIVPVSWIQCSGISSQSRQTPPTFSDLHTNP